MWLSVVVKAVSDWADKSLVENVVDHSFVIWPMQLKCLLDGSDDSFQSVKRSSKESVARAATGWHGADEQR